MIASFIGKDGSALVDIDGEETRLRGQDVEDARTQVTELARAHARDTDSIQMFCSEEPSGSWNMYVYPDGTMAPAEARVQPMAPPPGMFAIRRTAQATPEIAVAPARAPIPAVMPMPEPDVQTSSSPTDDDATQLAAIQDDFEDRTVVAPLARYRPALRFTLATGEEVDAATPAILGRNPEVSPTRHTLAFASPGKEMSRNHALVEMNEAGQIVVTDLGSANGTYANYVQLTAQTPTAVQPGDTLLMGDVAVTVHPFE